MEDSIYEKYGIEPNRIPTDSEVEVVAYCFGVSRSEAFEILSVRKLNTSPRIASSACDAHKEVSSGYENG